MKQAQNTVQPFCMYVLCSVYVPYSPHASLTLANQQPNVIIFVCMCVCVSVFVCRLMGNMLNYRRCIVHADKQMKLKRVIETEQFSLFVTFVSSSYNMRIWTL